MCDWQLKPVSADNALQSASFPLTMPMVLHLTRLMRLRPDLLSSKFTLMKNTETSNGIILKNSGVVEPDPRESTFSEANKGLRILVAEDHQTNRQVFERQLTRLGYSVDVVLNGKVALKAMQDKHYDLLLTDCHMPEMDGFELATAVRKLDDANKANIPIVAVTANALSGEAGRCVAAGMNDCLSKPVSLDAMSNTLRKWLSGDKTTQTSSAEQTPHQNKDNFISSEVEDVDKCVLEDLVGADDQVILSLLDSFIKNAQALLIELNEACANTQAEAFENAAHTLSGSAKTAGANRVAKTIDEIRNAVTKLDWHAVDEAMPQLEIAVTRVKIRIDSMRL